MKISILSPLAYFVYNLTKDISVDQKQKTLRDLLCSTTFDATIFSGI